MASKEELGEMIQELRNFKGIFFFRENGKRVEVPCRHNGHEQVLFAKLYIGKECNTEGVGIAPDTIMVGPQRGLSGNVSYIPRQEIDFLKEKEKTAEEEEMDDAERRWMELIPAAPD